jgi:hypothetical protein
MTTANLYQVATEAILSDPDPDLRLYQMATEVITIPSTTNVQLYQMAVEAIRPQFRQFVPNNPKTFTCG